MNTATSTREPATAAERPWKFLRRDYVLLPLISLCSILVAGIITEVASRVVFPQIETDSCSVSDPVLGHRYAANCKSIMKSAEGPIVYNRYNACGYRSDQPCGDRPAGTLRLAFTGSSVAQGYLVPYEDTVSTTLEKNLSDDCHAPVQVENMSMVNYQGEVIYAQMAEALRLRPDAVVYLVTPFDFDTQNKRAQPGAVQAPAHEWRRRLTDLLNESRAVLLAKHFMFKDDPIRHAMLTLDYGDNANYMRVPFTNAWQDRITYFSDLIGRMKTTLGNVPLIVAFVPSSSQSAFMAAPAATPAGVDPYAFGRALGAAAKDRGINYVDLSDSFGKIPDAGKLYYPQDGHLTAEGHPVVARDLASEIVGNRVIPACKQS